jgi:MFS family permease
MLRLAVSLGLAQVGFHAWIATLPVAMAQIGRPDAEIGVVVGAAAVVSLLAGLLVGALIDRVGGRLIYLAGTALLLAGAVPFALGLADADSSLTLLLVMRLMQGAGVAAVMPSVMTLVPAHVTRARLPTALALVGVAGNISLAFTPAASLALMAEGGLLAVGVLVCVSVSVGAVLLWPVHDVEHDALRGTVRPFRLHWRSSWAAPLATSVAFMAHWGVVTAYLPQRAERAGADIGLFFMADALGLLALRVPAGWLAGRIGSRPLILGGVALTLLGIALLLPWPSTPLLILAGLLTGAGSAFFFPAIHLELTLRSEAADRGSAFSLFSVAFGAGIAVGSLAVAPLYGTVGFELSLLGGLLLVAIAGLVTLADRALDRPAGTLPAVPVAPAPAPGPAPRGLDR